MMWAETAFSSVLVLSAIYLSSMQPSAVDSGINFAAYRHLEDAATLLAQAIHESDGGQAPPPAGKFLPPSSDPQLLEKAQYALDATTENTPYCLSAEVVWKNSPSLPNGDSATFSSCSGQKSPFPPQSKYISSNQISAMSSAWHRGTPVTFSLRQWTNPGN